MRLLTMLSALAAWSLLGVLMAGLYAILEPLKRVRRSLEQIAMGVRAIEQETAPLGGHIDAVAGRLAETGAGFGAVARRLGDVDQHLDGAVAALRRAR